MVDGRHDISSVGFEVRDERRDLTFPFEIWHPLDVTEPLPLVVYSHYSGGHRRAATFLTTSLARHGYVVVALDHAEVIDPALQPAPAESDADRAARAQAWIDNRVPDVRFLLDVVLDPSAAYVPSPVDAARVGIVGHSFGGWTALAAAVDDSRIRSVVALAPAGGRPARTGVIPVSAPFGDSMRAVPTLVIAAERDVAVPLATVRDLVAQCPWPTRLAVLDDADHLHFVDDVATAHEAFRALPADGDYAWIAEMRPIHELRPPDEAHAVIQQLTLGHFDATLSAG